MVFCTVTWDIVLSKQSADLICKWMLVWMYHHISRFCSLRLGFTAGVKGLLDVMVAITILAKGLLSAFHISRLYGTVMPCLDICTLHIKNRHLTTYTVKEFQVDKTDTKKVTVCLTDSVCDPSPVSFVSKGLNFTQKWILNLT